MGEESLEIEQELPLLVKMSVQNILFFDLCVYHQRGRGVGVIWYKK